MLGRGEGEWGCWVYCHAAKCEAKWAISMRCYVPASSCILRAWTTSPKHSSIGSTQFIVLHRTCQFLMETLDDFLHHLVTIGHHHCSVVVCSQHSFSISLVNRLLCRQISPVTAKFNVGHGHDDQGQRGMQATCRSILLCLVYVPELSHRVTLYKHAGLVSRLSNTLSRKSRLYLLVKS